MMVVRSTSSTSACHVIVDEVYLGEIDQCIQNVLVRSVRVVWRRWGQYNRLGVVHGELGELAWWHQGLERMVGMVMVVATGPGLWVVVGTTVATAAATAPVIVMVLHDKVRREA